LSQSLKKSHREPILFQFLATKWSSSRDLQFDDRT